MSQITPGTLYIVATPIGNLADISMRALEVLQQVALIAAEDTRHSKNLLAHYGITTKMLSLHSYNEAKRLQVLLQELNAGNNLALITDAGTPLISDPGSLLVAAVRAANIQVVPIPGACAAITALSAAGLATDKFVFEGFLPIKGRRTRLQEFIAEERTVILYEAPHRILKLITLMLEVLGSERYLVIAKELTKMHEVIYGAPISKVQTWLLADPLRQKGEFVILIQGVKATHTANAEALRVLGILAQELPLKKAVKLTASIFSLDKKALYQIALKRSC